MSKQNHIAAALSRLRRGVVGCAAGVFIAALVQLFVFGFVHFTDVRYQMLEDPNPGQHRTVVVTPTSNAAPAEPVQNTRPVRSIEEAVELMTAASVPDVNRVTTTMDVMLKRISQGAVVVGVFSAVGLAIFTMLGSIVAGGASVNGVDKAVSACMWGSMLCLLALPWQDVFVSMPFGGVFASYTSIVGASESTTPQFQLLLVFVGVPLVAMAGSMIAALRFGSGVERAILAGTLPPEMDAIDREMAASRQSVSTNRQIGSVNNNFVIPPPREPAEPTQRERAAEPPSRRRTDLSISRGEEAGEFKRPI